MKTSAIVCALLAGTFGLSGIASAEEHNDLAARLERQAATWNDSGSARGVDPRVVDAWAAAAGPQARAQAAQERAQQEYRETGQLPRYEQPQHRYVQQGYEQRHATPQAHFYRGAYLPRSYWQPTYYVNNWQAYPALYAPPHGYQWMNVDGNFLLVALATGLIANALAY